MTKKTEIPKDNNVIKIPIEDAMPDNYLPYAVEVAKDRALPDVRDGLKPVHRRILYGAYLLKAFSNKPYLKSARIVGDILGKFHPHGDSSVYEAMVILAQNFTTRYTLIDGHGNWGSQDGDSAAAMRYTEARLTNMAEELLRDIDKDVVKMVENYSGSDYEPEVLPARYPNLLVNGSFGIAVGLATNIPPHNLTEVIDAVLAYIDNKDISTKELMNYVKGPDMPTGGIIIGKNSLLSAYETGDGKVTLRAKALIERLDSGRLGIVITEFPYRKSKARILQNISDMTGDKKHSKALEGIMDIRDETDRTGIRAVIELKKSVDEDLANKILRYLYKKTDLQCTVSFNMVALADGKPEKMGLKTILYHYINHQKYIVNRRTENELKTAEKRFEIVEGLIKAIGIMDAIISTIRSSKSKADAKEKIMNLYGFTPVQSDAILELMLYRLTGLEITTFEKEYKELKKEIARLQKILSSEKELLKLIKKELTEIRDKYGDSRKTQIIEDDEEAKIDVEELIVLEDIMVTLSNEGYIKRVPLKSYNRSNTDVNSIEYREGDFNKFLFPSSTKEIVMFFTDIGNVYQIKGLDISEYKWKEKGERIDDIIKGFNSNDEKVVAVYSIADMNASKDFILFTTSGSIKKSSLDKYNTTYSKLSALKLKENEKLLDVILVQSDREEQFIKIKTKLGLEFIVEEPKIESCSRNTSSKQIFNLSSKDEVIQMEYVENYEFSTFVIGMDEKGILRVYDRPCFKDKMFCTSNSTSKLMFFTNAGEVFIVSAYMLQNIGKSGVDIHHILDLSEKDSILNVISTVNFSEDKNLYFISSNGLIKKTHLSEFNGDYYKTTSYKLKDGDTLKSVLCGDNNLESEIVIITSKAMSIRFDAKGVTYMGKVASGVTGISLKDEDKVFSAFLLEKNTNKYLVLYSKRKNEKKIKVQDIKLQNRAGRGNNIMLIVMDDSIEEIELQNS